MTSGSFAKNPIQHERLEAVGRLADELREKAHETDARNEFSFSSIEALRKFGYPSYTVPLEYGGLGISLYEMVLYQERLAMGDPAIALGMGWHLSVVAELAEQREWEESKFERLCRDIVESGALINKAATERATGSPSRGGKPATAAVRAGDEYVLNGRKSFTTLAPVLDYFIVTATLTEEDRRAEFLLPKRIGGLSVEPTWNMVGMRGTASHDLVLDNVRVPADALVTVEASRTFTANPWLLHIPACYLGIALAAKREAQKFAAAYRPNTLDRPILYVPHIGQQLGQMEFELSAARHYLYSVAARWEEEPERRAELVPELGAVKVMAVQTALSVVDKAMRIAGAHGLAMSHPLQRLYRDVRFGLHNPPMEDQVMQTLAKRAIREAEQLFPPAEGNE